MRSRIIASGLLVAVLVSAAPASAQLARTNAIWARTAPAGSITLDGNLNEAVWATAESWRVHYRYDSSNPVAGTQGIPGSGWKDEGGFPPTSPNNDSTNALLRFLVVGNQLYLAASVPDKSIGGGGGFNYFDGFLMGIKDRLALDEQGNPVFPKPINEYLYSWWYPRESGTVCPCAQAIDSAVGNPPIFKGRWAPDPVCDCVTGQVVPRTAEQIAAWDARTVVVGTTNTDAHGTDVSWTVEMRFDLGVMGYDVTDADGDIVEWNISIYDTDNWWKSPLGFDLSRNRTWWQNPWGRDMFHDEVRIYARPAVTTASGAVPAIEPDFKIPNAGSATAPTINGTLTESIWSQAPGFDIRWDDAALRASYPTVGKWRSGQFQPDVQGGKAFVVNGGDATVKYFFKGDMLYMGFDVRDQYVQHYNLEDRWDGFTVSITHRTEMDPEDHNLQGKGLSFIVGPSGNALAQEDLVPLVGVGGTQVALALKPGTVLDTTGTSTDQGYTAELAVNLTQLGYPSGLGDRTMFLGVTLYDGDSFGPPLSVTDSYATRTWWFRERKEACCPAWTYLDPALGLVGVGDPGGLASRFAALGNFPNPFRSSTRIKFALPRESEVSLEVFDLRGRMITQRSLGTFAAGVHETPVQLAAARAGVYLYRLRLRDPESGASLATLAGKMMVVR
jgi:hypothetical protein